MAEKSFVCSMCISKLAGKSDHYTGNVKSEDVDNYSDSDLELKIA